MNGIATLRYHHATLAAPAEHDGLVLAIAKRYTWALKQGALEFTDLVQVGRMGIEQAKRRFKPEMGYKFSTYATWWVRHHMGRLCADHGSTIRIPVAKQHTMRESGRVSTFYHRMSLDLEVDNGSDNSTVSLLDVLCPTDSGEEDHGRLELGDRIAKAMEKLPKRERTVLHIRFFRDGTLEDAGKEFGFSRERARQVESRALAMLKAELTGTNWRVHSKNTKSYNAAKHARYRRLRELGYSGKFSKNESGCVARFKAALEAKGVSE